MKKSTTDTLFYKVDGYDYKTNTVYEFNGSYWHGNPDYYDAEQYNTRKNMTFGELYEATITREKMIKSMGYNLVSKWGVK